MRAVPCYGDRQTAARPRCAVDVAKRLRMVRRPRLDVPIFRLCNGNRYSGRMTIVPRSQIESPRACRTMRPVQWTRVGSAIETLTAVVATIPTMPVKGEIIRSDMRSPRRQAGVTATSAQGWFRVNFRRRASRPPWKNFGRQRLAACVRLSQRSTALPHHPGRQVFPGNRTPRPTGLDSETGQLRPPALPARNPGKLNTGASNGLEVFA
jgi:hypothetical protein